VTLWCLTFGAANMTFLCLLYEVKPWDHCFFVLRCFDDTVHNFKVPSKIDSLAMRKVRWKVRFFYPSFYKPGYKKHRFTTQISKVFFDTEWKDKNRFAYYRSTKNKKKIIQTPFLEKLESFKNAKKILLCGVLIHSNLYLTSLTNFGEWRKHKQIKYDAATLKKVL